MNVSEKDDPLDLDATRLLLLDLLRPDADRVNDDRLQSLDPAGWERLLSLANDDRVTAAVHYGLKQRGLEEAVPAQVGQLLQAAYHDNAFRNMRLYHQLGQLLAEFEAQDIPVVVLKGAFLAEEVYGNVALRQMSDIDLLLPQADIEQAAGIMDRLGYGLKHDHLMEVGFERGKHLPKYLKPNSVPVEIHWAITSPVYAYHVGVEGLWARAQPVILSGKQALGLCPEDLLLHVCVHASYDNMFTLSLRSLLDVCCIAAHYGRDLDWTAVVDRTIEYGWRKGIFLTLNLSRDLLGAAVPPQELERLRPDDFDPRFETIAVDQLLIEKEQRGYMPSPNLARLQGGGGLADRARQFSGHAFASPRSLMRVYPLPGGAFKIGAYYLERMRLLLSRQGRNAWQLLRRDRQATTALQKMGTLLDWLAEDAGQE